MKTNTFYKPKNEYNELLASQPYVDEKEAKLIAAIETEAIERDKADASIREDVNATITQLTADYIAADNKLHTKIDTLNTIKVVTITNFDSIEDYFEDRWNKFPAETKADEVEKLKVELSQTIYLIAGKDDKDTYEEYVCRSFSDVTTDPDSLEMVRLGAVDSILARLNSYGSVKLVHEIYENANKHEGDADEYWAQYHVTKFDTNNKEIKVPVKGLAVAPCSLKAFVDRDNEINNTLTQEIADRKTADISIRTDVNAALEKLTSDYIAADANLDKRLTSLEVEVGGSTVGDEVDKHDSRLDLIEAAIGMNHHHCDNCGCEHTQCSEHDSCSCTDAVNKCTIYCRLNDAENDLQEHMDTLEDHGERITSLEETTLKHTEDINNLQVEDAEIRTLIGDEVARLDVLIEGNVKRIDGRIDEAESKITKNENYISSVEERLEAEENRSNAMDAILREEIDTEVEIRAELSDYVHHVLDETVAEHSTLINNNLNAIDAHDTRITSAESKIGDLQTALNVTDNAVREHYSEFLAEVSKLTTDIGTNTNSIANINNDISNRINDKLDSLSIKDATIVSSIADLENKVEEADNDLGDRLAAVERDVNDAKNDIDKNKVDLTVLTSRITIAETTLENHAAAISKNENLIFNNSQVISGLKTDLSATELTLTDSVGRIETLENQIIIANSTIDDHNTRIISVEGSVELLDERTDSLDTKIDKEIEVLNGHITEISGVLNETKESLSATDTKVKSLEEDFEKVLDGQTQFIISTTLPASGSKEIKISNLFADEESESSEWSIFSVNSVAIVNDHGWEVIYPEVEYLGSDETENNGTDNRLIKITFESGNTETVRIAISAFKKINARIKTID